LQRGATLSLAESCTGGNLAHLFTLIPGISSVLLGGVVAYANELKTGFLGVPAPLLTEHGAVSGPVVAAMAENIRKQTGSDYAIATSGIAGPGGGTDQKPVGTVWIAVASAQQTVIKEWHFYGTREHIIERATNTACQQLLKLLETEAHNR
jgi:nicotinamide-nucleotide amidase